MRPLFQGLAFVVLAVTVSAADPVFSGPQPGERISGFKVAPVGTESGPAERDPVAGTGGKPIALVFLHGLERSFVPLLRVIDSYGARQKDQVQTEIVFLAPDRISGEQRMKAAQGSLRLKSKIGVSVDGVEGPGNYGLNKDCLMTIILAKDNRVVDNFALVQPGIADAPKVLAALAKLAGDPAPPNVEELSGPARRMERATRGEMEVEKKDAFPGAVPTDPTLNGLIRRFIRPTNEDGDVDQLLKQIKNHIKDDPALKRQAIDGFTRVLHFGDRYGTAYARKAGTEFLESLKK